jgi:creatinine amidohydrolase
LTLDRFKFKNAESHRVPQYLLAREDELCFTVHQRPRALDRRKRAGEVQGLILLFLGDGAMRFHEMTFPELRQVPRDATLVLAPIAACEQHSRHLPTYTDTILVTAVAEGVEQKLPKQVLLLPTLWFGASHHHLRFGATLSADVDLHMRMIEALLLPLLDDGHRRLMVLNGHGGNIDTMQVALRRLQPRYRNRLLSAASYWDLAAKELAALAEGPRKTMGHACEFETSMVLALQPELVRREQIQDDPPKDDPVLRGLYLADDMRQRTDHGAVGYPERASAEKGQAFLDAAIARTVEVVTALLRRPLPE